MSIHYEDSRVTLHYGDCLDVLRTLPDASVDSVVTDPPYNLTAGKKGGTGVASVNLESPYGRSRIGTGNGAGGFMGQAWDDYDHFPGGFYGWCEAWATECLRVLKPGGHLLAFGGTRTWHRLACAVEDAGFEVRDSIAWLYGSGFPKSLDVSKAIDKAAGAEREVVSEGTPVKRMIPGADQNRTGSWIKDNGREFVPTETAPATDAAREWAGWGTALKPAFEPVVVARKPLVGTVAANVLTHGTGALNIDGCRIEASQSDVEQRESRNGTTRHAAHESGYSGGWTGLDQRPGVASGRWPANVILDEVMEPVLRLRYNLPVGVERAIREGFGASTSHLPAVRDDDHGPAEQGAATEVLHPRLPGAMDGGEPHGREGAQVRPNAYAGVAGEDVRDEAGTGSHRAAVSALEGRDVPQSRLRDGEARRADAGGTGDGGPDGAQLDEGRVPAGTPASGGPDEGSSADERRARAPRERREDGQPAGELGDSRGRRAPQDARSGRARGLQAASGEPATAPAPLEVLRRECPPGWWQYFDVIGERREGMADVLDEQSGTSKSPTGPVKQGGRKINGGRYNDSAAGEIREGEGVGYGDSGGASRFFFVAPADGPDGHVVIGKGGMIEPCETASTAAENSSQPRQFGASAPSAAATSGRHDTALQMASPSTSETPSGSRRNESQGTPTPSTDGAYSPEQKPVERTQTLSPASSVEPSAQTDTTTTTTSPAISGGSAALATSSTTPPWKVLGDTDSARFKYVAKAPKRERPVVDGVAHPTVKPLALMRWLVRLVTPPGGTVLEPFAGSGTTVEACLLEGFQCIAIEKGDEYLPLILERIRRQTEPPEVEHLTRHTDPEVAIVEQVREMSLFELDGEGA